MNCKAVFLAIVAVLSAMAQASFDLVLVADSTQDCIHRYDGDTGVYLGKFGQNFLDGITSTDIDPTTNTLWVGAFSGLFEFNYNTGELLNYNPGLTTFTEMHVTSQGGILRTLGNTTNSLSYIPTPRTSASTTSAFTVLENWSATGMDSTGDVFSVGSTSGTITRFNQISGVIEATTTSATLIGATGADVRANQMLVMNQNGRLDNLNSQSLAVSLGGFQGSMVNGVDVAFAHNNMAWGVGTNGTGNAVLQPYRTTFSSSSYAAFGNALTLSQVNTPVSISVVLAPEPGTMIALGVGAAGLLRARSSRRSRR